MLMRQFGDFKVSRFKTTACFCLCEEQCVNECYPCKISTVKRFRITHCMYFKSNNIQFALYLGTKNN